MKSTLILNLKINMFTFPIYPNNYSNFYPQIYLGLAFIYETSLVITIVSC